MTISVVLAMLLFAMTSLLHFGMLVLAKNTCQPQWRALTLMAWVFFVAFLAHLAEILLYAGGFWLGERILQIGSFGGMRPESFLDYFYYSSVTFTSLGLGDIFPGGHLRFLTGVEALNGLMLIAWTGSYTFYLGLRRTLR